MLDPDRRLLGVTARAPLALPPGGAHWSALHRIGEPDPATFLDTFPRLEAWLAGVQDEAGIPPERTVIGGFSQGGVMTYALGLAKGRPRPAALVAMSSFMPTVPEFELDLSQPLPPIAIAHGIHDPIIGAEWGRQAAERLREAGADVLHREYPIPHTIDGRFLDELRPWLARVLEPAPA
jgi:phospholipase/carboxylesterase